MAVDVKWYDEKENILHYRLSGNWKWEEYEAANRKGRAMMRQKTHYIGILTDLREMNLTPHLMMTKVNQYIKTRPDNTGLGIFVTSSSFLYKVYDMITRIYPSYLTKYHLETDFNKAVQDMQDWLEEHKDVYFEIVQSE